MENNMKPGPSVPPLPQKVAPMQSTQVSVKSASAQQPPVSNEVIIRTMQDDLNAPKKIAAPPVAKPKIIQQSTEQVEAKQQMTEPATLPLPPNTESPSSVTVDSNPKVVMVPQAVKRKNMMRLAVTIAVIVFVVIGFSAAGFYLWFIGQKPSEPVVSPVVAGASDVLPAGASLIIQYKISSADDRASVLTAWNKRPEASNMASLLRGDPRMVLEDASINEFYYVTLQNETRPYFVIPKTSSTTKLLGENSEVRLSEKSGWYIAHSIGTEEYVNELAQKTLGSLENETVLTTTTEQAPIRVIAGPGSLMKWRESLGGNGFANGELQELSFASRLISGGSGLEVSGLAVPLHAPSAGESDQQLLSLVPDTAQFVRLGSNLSEDLASWGKTASLLDNSVFAQPNVQTLLTQLNTPYAFFVTDDNVGKHSYGLIVTLPANMSPALAVGDQAIENGLMTLVPLLTGKKSIVPLAFSDGSKNDIPLRYVNLSGTASALDYLVTDKYLEIATSKDVMFSLADVLIGNSPSVASSQKYNQLFSLWGALPNGHDVILGNLNTSAFHDLLPIDPKINNLPFGLVIQPASDAKNLTVQGAIQLSAGGAESLPTPISDNTLVSTGE